MVDLDGDGHVDIISGSYWPGNLYMFKGKPDGTFEKGAIIKDLEGKNLNAGGPWKSLKEPDLDSLAASPFACDFRGTGVMDLLVGNVAGHVVLIPNEGTPRAPAFNHAHRRLLEADGQPITVPGGDAGPFVADWDLDGTPDLLVGSGDGAVLFYRNIGTKTEPRFARGVEIIPKCSRGWDPVRPGASPERPGMRTKICVVDWNGDGLPDLLVGDYWSEQPVTPTLTEADLKKRDELKTRRLEIVTRWSRLYEEAARRGHEGPEDPEMKKVREELRTVDLELSQFEPPSRAHGSVWLYLRKGKSPEGKRTKGSEED